MDMRRGLNRTDHLHVCHVDLDKLDNGMASIVKVEGRCRHEIVTAYIDTRGFFRSIDNDSAIPRDKFKLR